MNTNQDTTLTNRAVFEVFYKTIQPVVPQAGYEDVAMDAAYLSYQAATKASEQRIQELERRCEALDIEFDQRDAIRLSAITELQANVNQLREALESAMNDYAGWYDIAKQAMKVTS